jgi:hypothetical protein
VTLDKKRGNWGWETISIYQPNFYELSEKGVRCNSKIVRFDFEIVLYDAEIVPFDFKIVHYDPENTVFGVGLRRCVLIFMAVSRDQLVRKTRPSIGWQSSLLRQSSL